MLTMKLKYYLRGVGTGIILTAVILSISYHATSKSRFTDTEIMKRAEELGMVEQSEIDMNDIISPTVTPTAKPAETSEKQESDTSSAEPAQESTGTSTSNTTEKSVDTTTLKTTEKSVGQTTEKSAGTETSETSPESEDISSNKDMPAAESSTVPEQSKDLNEGTEVSSAAPAINQKAENETEQKSVSFTIVKGMTSEEVAKLLKEKRIIEDARAFNQYLKQNNYTTKIDVGEFQMEKFAAYQDIADTIISE